MGCHTPSPDRSTPPGALTLAVAGNPNCGKSALFNTLTGIRQKTGNWPGVTVDRKQGRFELQGQPVTLVDLPGIYSLDAASVDETITRDYLLSGDADLVINVVDGANLERNLYLTVQLLEMGVPMVLAVNMMDVVRRRGLKLQLDQLAEHLGCTVVPIVATSGEGIDQLLDAVAATVWQGAAAGFPLAHDEPTKQAIAALLPLIRPLAEARGKPYSDRCAHWMALKLLEGSETVPAGNPALSDELARQRQAITGRTGEEVDVIIADSRFSHAHALARKTLVTGDARRDTLSDRIDRAVLHQVFGIPIFLGVMYLMFMFTINIGGAFVDFFDGVGSALFSDGPRAWMSSVGLPEWLIVVVADGAGAGVAVVATFIPIIAALYLFLSVVEDSGYMARAAFVMDRFMRTIGLPGKAFVPMIVGFGCNVPAVMATRTLENERERKLTILLNPFMSCGARLPVYALFAAAFFPSNGQNLVFALYLIGILVAIGTGLAMKKTLLSGESTGFMMELPPYHLPTLKGVLLRTWDRVRVFIKEAGQVIVVMVLALNLINSVGTDGSLGNQHSENSVLTAVGKAITPIFAPLGIEQDNWPATVGIFTGVLAKEAVVGTLDALYTRLAAEDAGNDRQQAPFELWSALQAAAATVPENLAAVSERLLDPLGLDVGDIDSTTTAAESQQVSIGVFGAMERRFDGQVGAFAFLLFILLYSPCAATIAAIKRETNGAWTAFVVAWTTGIAYITASLYYQLATLDSHPQSSITWALFLGLVLVGVLIGLRLWARRDTCVEPVTGNAK